jgi:proline iminopeptidase
VELHVVELGAEHTLAPPLIALHGGPAAHHDYLLPAFAALAGERRVILYDQRGGGKSRVPPGTDLSAGAHVADVGAVLDGLGAEAADLCGYSFGGLWAMRFAAAHPERVRRLALCSSVPLWHGYREGLDRALAAAQRSEWMAAERAALDASGLKESVPDEYRRRRFALSVAGYFHDPRLAYALTPFRVQQAAAEAVRRSLGDFDFRGELSSAALRPGFPRSIVIHGEDDPIDVALARETAAILGARFEPLPACGHVPYVEASGKFFAILRAFLGEPS